MCIFSLFNGNLQNVPASSVHISHAHSHHEFTMFKVLHIVFNWEFYWKSQNFQPSCIVQFKLASSTTLNCYVKKKAPLNFI